MAHCPPPPNSTIDKLDERASAVVLALEKADLQLVLAESCTAGLVAATLGGVPGVSRFLRGSSVVYHGETKIAWLDVPQEMLAKIGTVAPEVSAVLAQNVLDRTPGADFAVAVTGHLGPDAPADLDGVIHMAVCFPNCRPDATECRLPVTTDDPAQMRRDRQRLATIFVLDQIQAACDQKIAEPSRDLG